MTPSFGFVGITINYIWKESKIKIVYLQYETNQENMENQKKIVINPRDPNYDPLISLLLELHRMEIKQKVRRKIFQGFRKQNNEETLEPFSQEISETKDRTR